MANKTAKILVVGASRVGKTSLISRILDEPVPLVYEPTQDNWFTGIISTAGMCHLVCGYMYIHVVNVPDYHYFYY